MPITCQSEREEVIKRHGQLCDRWLLQSSKCQDLNRPDPTVKYLIVHDWSVPVTYINQNKSPRQYLILYKLTKCFYVSSEHTQIRQAHLNRLLYYVTATLLFVKMFHHSIFVLLCASDILHVLLLFFGLASRKWMRQAMQSCNWRSKYFPCFSKRFVSVQRSSIFDLEIKPILDGIGPEQGRGSNIEYWRVEPGKYWLGINPSEPISHIARRRLQPRIKNRSIFGWLPIHMSTTSHLEIDINMEEYFLKIYSSII